MAIHSYFFNAVYDSDSGTYDRTYNAEDMTSYLDLLVGNGVFPNPSTQLQVRASSGMNVVVGAGSGWINGHKLVNTADMILALDSSDVLLNRIDIVIFYVDFNSRSMGIEVKKGSLAENPKPPALQRDASRYEMCLAEVRINKQITDVTTSMIYDSRGDSEVCGYVQGLIQQVGTTTLFEQFQAAFDEWFEAAKSQFQAGKSFRKLEGVYVTQEANEATFNVQTYVPHYSFVYDILEVYISGIHLNGNEYTISNNYITLEKPIEDPNTVITFVVYQFIDTD